MRFVFLLVSVFFLLLLTASTDLNGWETASIGFLIYFLLDLVDNYGKRIVILHFFIVLAIIQWLLMPILAYRMFDESNYLARLWVKYMEVPASTYFPYILPGTLAMIAGFKFPLKKPRFFEQPNSYILQAKEFLTGKKQLGYILIVLGSSVSIIGLVVGEIFGNILFLTETMIYAGVLYLYLSDFKPKSVVLAGLILFEGFRALQSGMFGGSLFLFIIIMIILGLEWNPRFGLKIAFIIIGFIGVIILQSAKGEYREQTWGDNSKAGLGVFSNVVSEQINNRDNLINENNIFFLILRFNNGWQISRTMDRVPKRYPFANGESIFMSLAATAVPRFLWPDKPKSGGRANLERFWGESYGRTAMNISPIGEAYANFGVYGGIVYMFFFGLALNWAIIKIMFWVQTRPTILCWFPTIFYSFFGVETDLLNIANSFVKGVIFTYVFIRLFKATTGRDL